MGVILNERGEILRSFIDKNRDSDVDTRLFQTQLTQKNDSQTVQQFQLSGFRSRPPDGTKIIVTDLGDGAFKISIAEDDGILNDSLGLGESFVYSSSGGVVVASVYLKNDGKLQVDTDSDLIANVGGDLIATVSGATTVNSTGTLELIAPLIKLTGPVECSETVDAVGNISTEADLSADGDAIADALGAPISLKLHQHLGNLGYNTGPSLPAGGGSSPPASPPSSDSSGDLITGNGNSVDTLRSDHDGHKHSQDPDSDSSVEEDTSTPI